MRDKQLQRRRIAIRLTAIINAEENGLDEAEELNVSDKHVMKIADFWLELADHVLNTYREHVWANGWPREKDPLECSAQRKQWVQSNISHFEQKEQEERDQLAKTILAVMKSGNRKQSSIEQEYQKIADKPVSSRWVSVAKAAREAFVEDLRDVAAPIINRHEPKSKPN